MKESVITAAAMLLAFLLITGCLMILFTYSMNCIHSHGLYMQAGTIATGLSLSIFRLCRGAPTMVVKYLHFAFIAFAVILFALGSKAMVRTQATSHVHRLAGYITLAALAIEIVLGIFLFTYLYEYRWLRVNFAPIHNIVGIWIYGCLVGCCIAGNHSVNPMEVVYQFYEQSINAVFLAGYEIVIILLVSPFFEWELVGRL